MMGSKTGSSDETPRHKVTLQAFSIGVYEVTFEEYDQFAATTSVINCRTIMAGVEENARLLM